MASQGTERRLAAILSADVVGYSRLMAEDEDETVRRLAAYRTEITNLVGEHRGRVVDFTGDNFLAEFPTATDAVEAAAEIQRVLKARNAAVPAGRAMEFRIGVHLGDIRVEGERIFGDGVNIAARLEGLAEPGGICISDDVLHQVQRKLELDFDDLGEQTVKNIPDPVHAYRLRERAAETPTTGAWLRIGTRPVVVGLAVIALVALAWWGWNQPVATTGPIRSIAVLPLENLSGDPEQEYFADGMTEALIGDLARIGSLRVISRTSVMRYKQSDKSLPEIARELGVEGVIEGTVVREGDRVRITAQLIDGRSDQHLWADRFDRDFRSVLALQSDVARAIAQQVRVTLTPKEEASLASARPVNPDAHEAYLKGRAAWMRGGPDDRRVALGYFQQAIQTDPGYALGYAGLSDAYSGLALLGVAPPAELMPKAEAAALKALELDDTLAEAHLSAGTVRMYYDWDLPAAKQEVRRALELNPSHALGHLWMALYFGLIERKDQAFERARLALKYDPLSAAMKGNAGIVHFIARDYEEAERLFREALALDPSYARALSNLGTIYSLTSRHDEAIAQYEKLDRLASGVWPLGGLGHAYAMAGRREDALRVLDELDQQSPERYVSAMTRVNIYVALGDHDKAFEWLERSYEEHTVGLVFLPALPTLDPLRSDPRFQDLLRRIGFPES